ncbi:MAG TPA: hypothetical protein VFP20_00745 [Bacteroidales bacterium]|nr:hypothetical protein [Bacteroidales bacterium]
MKKNITLFLGIALSFATTFAQNVIYNGETTTPDFWDIGGGFGIGYDQGPNGADCHKDEGWKLYVSGKMDIMSEGVTNPETTVLNNTPKVVRFVRAKNGEGWAGAGLDILSKAIKDNYINKFSILVKKPVEGNVTLKLEGNGVVAQQQTQLYNTPGQWQKLTFTFDVLSFTANPATLLVFPHDQGGLAETIITYWDEVTMYSSADVPTVIYNGDVALGSETAPGFFLDGYWGPNGSLSDLQTDVFPNLNATGMNTSAHVMRFLRAKDGKSWCGIGCGGQNINVSTYNKVSIMINKAVAGRVGCKLEGAGSQEVYADYTTPGEWAKLIFTFDPSKFTGNPNTIVIFPHFEDTDISNLAAHTPIYIDNVESVETGTVLSELQQDAAVLSTEYFSLTGQQMGNRLEVLSTGIYIQRNKLANGLTTNRKIQITNR